MRGEEESARAMTNGSWPDQTQTLRLCMMHFRIFNTQLVAQLYILKKDTLMYSSLP